MPDLWGRAAADFAFDLHHGLRVVRRNPGYAAIAMLCLALGIGVNATVFSFLDGVYFRLLPVPEADRVVTIDRNGSAPCFWRDCQALRGLDAFSGVAAAMARGTFMDVDRANFTIVAETVSANYADVLRLKPALGRWFLPADESPGAEPVVVIGAHLWDTWFRRDPGVLGRYVRIELERYRIVGVAPENFRGVSPPVRVDAWLPLATFPITRAQLADPHVPGPPSTWWVGSPLTTTRRAPAPKLPLPARFSVKPIRTRPAMPLQLRCGFFAASPPRNRAAACARSRSCCWPWWGRCC